ncbi:type II toxin-antitoxin system PemK/MazF family toxin [Rhodococcus hoagii]|uniref:Type II toxin-antitoxin system PemK/MazF family toxin n=1 Tax=Rhodococcus hoagii TaxID=43767 RepID=A0A9Q4ZIJ4_RHOHA|nr:type II toxin-antitoxin system PemK/MazF family toxin [Prescottella equi]NKT77284.1 type II toxin-antitoxin system PemK/MazF family toxin [Prescottella equi]NKZ81071.1 type II toxin-antitoxin system PemK/MazF family toxin [Prescottella equi]
MRGDIHVLRNDPHAKGHEQRGQRYCVILQTDALEVLSTVIVAPTTGQDLLGRSWRVPITVKGEKSLLLIEQTRAVDKSRVGELVGHVTRDELDRIAEALAMVLDL